MKLVYAYAGLAVMLATVSFAAAGHQLREKADKAGIVTPQYERMRIEKPVAQRPQIQTRDVPVVFRHPNVRILDPLPHQLRPRPPYRHVAGSGYDPTPYRIGPRPRSQERSIVDKRFYHRNPSSLKPDREITY